MHAQTLLNPVCIIAVFVFTGDNVAVYIMLWYLLVVWSTALAAGGPLRETELEGAHDHPKYMERLELSYKEFHEFCCFRSWHFPTVIGSNSQADNAMAEFIKYWKKEG